MSVTCIFQLYTELSASYSKIERYSIHFQELSSVNNIKALTSINGTSPERLKELLDDYLPGGEMVKNTVEYEE